MPEGESFVIHPTVKAAEALAGLDPSLRQEVCEHCAAVADDPAGMLARATSALGEHELYVSSYRSDFDPSLEVELYFAKLDMQTRRAVLVLIVMRRHE